MQGVPEKGRAIVRSITIRKLAHNMPYLGHPAYCHCDKCWQPSAAWRAFRTLAPWAAFAIAIWFVGVLCIWAVNGFPGMMRIQ